MKVALYARVSTKDGDLTPENQLLLLRQYENQMGWETVNEYVDLASATDLRGRSQWRKLLDQVHKGGVDLGRRGQVGSSFSQRQDGLYPVTKALCTG